MPLFSDLFKQYRTLNPHQTQIDISVELNVERSVISKYENGLQIPPLTRARELAKLMNKTVNEVTAAIEESQRTRNSPEDDMIFGNYELYQWSYFNDRKIMKTNIVVTRDGRKIGFTESVKTGSSPAIIKGTVQIERPNLFFSGKGQNLFRECELIIIPIPRLDEWVAGVVSGVSSDRNTYPSATRTAVHYIGHDDFTTSAAYGEIDGFALQPYIRDYLAMPVDSTYPVIGTREFVEDSYARHAPRVREAKS